MLAQSPKPDRSSWQSADNNPDWVGIWKCWFKFLRVGKHMKGVKGLFIMYIYGQFHVINLLYRILYSLYFTVWKIKTEFYLEGLLHEIGLIYVTNKLHQRKCFVRILFTRCKTLETHSFATLTRSFIKFCNLWIKIRTAHFLWSNLFLFLSNWITVY